MARNAAAAGRSGRHKTKRPRKRPPARSGAAAKPLYAQLMELLEKEIKEKNLQPGDRLRSERELMRALGLSYPTVTRALRELVHAGLLERRQGKGTFVRARPEVLPPGGAPHISRPKNLVVGGSWSPVDFALIRRAVGRFARRHPGVRVSFNEWDMNGAPAGDLFRVIGNRVWRYAGHAAPLDAWLARRELAARPHPAARALYHLEGRDLGIARSFAPCVLYFRRDLFRQAGLAEPDARWTWASLLEAARALTDPKKGRVGLAVFPKLSYGMAFVWQAGGRLWDGRRRVGLLHRGGALQGLETYRSLYRLAPPEQRLIGEPILEVFESFARGTSAMLIWGGYLGAHLRAHHRKRCPEGQAWAVAPLPKGPAEQQARPRPPGGATVFFSEGLCLHKDSRHPELALALLDELTGLEAARDLSTAGYRLPALASVWPRDPITEVYRKTIPAGRSVVETRQVEAYQTAEDLLTPLFSTDVPTREILKGISKAVSRKLAAPQDGRASAAAYAGV